MLRSLLFSKLRNVCYCCTLRNHEWSNLSLNSEDISKLFTDHLPKAELDLEYLCNSVNKEIIELNIKKRKGVGDLNRVLELHELLKNAVPRDKSVLEEEFLKEAIQIPNKFHPDLLQLGDEPMILHKINEKKEFKFKPKEFSLISKILKVLRTENLGNFSGHKSYYLLGELAEMEQALIKIALNNLFKKGFKLISVPDILPKEIIEGCGMNTLGDRTQVFKLDSEKHSPNLMLSGTSEMALAGFFANKVLSSKELPVKHVAVSRCYRAETSSTAEERGIYRVHQFTKVEMFAVTDQEKSSDTLEEFRAIQEEFFASFGLHIQTLNMPLHELGPPAYQKYDIEAWLPGRGIYGEVSSCSNCTDYQSRRLNIKFCEPRENKLLHVHTVNGTACAIPRMLIALFENYQQSNGSVLIPEVLQQFIDGKKVIERKYFLPKFSLLREKLQ